MGVGEILITQDQIQNRIKELAKQISEDYHNNNNSRCLAMVCVLKGAIFFFADLIKSLSIPVELNFIALSSYASGSGTQSSGEVELIADLGSNFSGKDVMVIDDIVDTGNTLSWLVKEIKAQNPASLKTCCLLNKNSRREKEVHIDYVGFEIPNYFVVGYGLDYKEQYRNLPHISILKESDNGHVS
jgi:hypoxanthine phosphoribosyltransferase